MCSVKSELIDSLKNSIPVLRQFVSTIPENQLRVQRSIAFWSVEQHIKHLALTQPMLFERLELISKDKLSIINPYQPDEKEKKQQKKLSIKKALDQFEDWRKKQCSLISTFNQEEWLREIKHPEYILYNTEILVRHILAHDYWHMYRIEELWLARNLD